MGKGGEEGNHREELGSEREITEGGRGQVRRGERRLRVTGPLEQPAATGRSRPPSACPPASARLSEDPILDLRGRVVGHGEGRMQCQEKERSLPF